MVDAPTLSVVIATRRPFSSLTPVLDALLPQVRSVGGEVVVAGGGGEADGPPTDDTRFVAVADADILRLRAAGLAEARGTVVAIGEDHAFPMDGWADAILVAHRDHPETPVVLGCLVNTTDRRSSARANFLAFAAPFAPPMPSVPDRPPPVSVVSIKAGDLADSPGNPGVLENSLLPRLHLEGRMVADDRIRMDHRQDFGTWHAMANAFHVARASYGYARPAWSKEQRRAKIRFALREIMPGSLREARRGRGRAQYPRRDLGIVVLIAVSSALGAALGAWRGPGRSPLRSA